MSDDISFKRVRQVGTLPQQKILNDHNIDTSVWQKFKKSKLIKLSSSFSESVLSTRKSSYGNDILSLFVAAKNRIIMYHGHNFSEEKSILKLMDSIQTLCVRNDGKLLAVGTVQGEIFIIDVESRLKLRTFKSHKTKVQSLSFINDTTLLSTSDDKSFKLWDIPTGEELWNSFEHDDFIRCCCVSKLNYSGNGKLFAVGSYDHFATVWDSSKCLETNSEKNNIPILKFNHGSPIESMVFLHCGSILVTAGMNSIKLWSIVDNGRLVQEIIVHHKSITNLSISPDSRFLLSSSLDQSIKIISLEKWGIIHQFKFNSAVLGVTMSLDSLNLSVGLGNSQVIVCTLKGILKPKERENKGNIEIISKNAAESFTSVSKKNSVPLGKFDHLLRKFKFREAFDLIIQRRNIGLLALGVRELMRRDALVVSLSSRTDLEICMVLEMIIKSIRSPRYSSILIELVYVIIDIYSSVLSESEQFMGHLKILSETIGCHVSVQRRLMSLEGSIFMLQA